MEENEKEKCKECFNCWHYYPYYTKGYFKFNKVRVGFCHKTRETVNNHGSCDLWAEIKYRCNKFLKPSTEKALYEILAKLSEIRQILEEQPKNEK